MANLGSTDDHIYRCPNHGENIMTELNKLRKNRQMIDLELVCDGVSIPVHRILLASSTLYFYTMLTTPLEESRSKTVPMRGLDAQDLKQLIDFIYTGEMKINADNVQSLLQASNLLQFWNIKQECSEYLLTRMDATNCLSVRKLAAKIDCPKLEYAAQRMVEEYFCEVVQSDVAFLEMSDDDMHELLSSDELNADEDSVLEALIRWVSYDKENRENVAELSCDAIRFTHLSSEKVRSLALTVGFFQENDWSYKMLSKAFEFFMSNERSRIYHKSRRGTIGAVLMVTGGQIDGKMINSANGVSLRDLIGDDVLNNIRSVRQMTDETYYPTKQNSVKIGGKYCVNRTYLHTDLPEERSHHAMIVVNKSVHIVGGRTSGGVSNSLLIYDMENRQWRDGPPMTNKRLLPGVCAFDNDIYVIGGDDLTNYLRECEVFRTRHGKWEPIIAMRNARDSLGVTVLNGLIYAAGGWNGKKRFAHLERYDPTMNTWSTMADMTQTRCGVSLCAIWDRIFAVGGLPNSTTAEVYTPETNVWEPIANVNSPRYYSYLFEFHGSLFVIGGRSKDARDLIEKYDLSTKNWEALPMNEPLTQIFSGYAVI